MGGSLPFRSGVVVSLRPLSVCHGSLWLVPAFFPSLSLSFPVCAHLQLGWTFLLLPDCPSPYFGLLVYWFLWLLFSTRVTYLRDGVTPAGSWPACPRSERRFPYLHLGQVRWSVPGWTSRLCLRVSARHVKVCCLVVLMCPYCWVPLCSLQGSSRSLVRDLGCLSSPTLFLPAGVGASVGCSALRPDAACALFPGVPLSPLCTPGP